MLKLSTDAINSDFATKDYKKWAKKLNLKHTVHHAKFWEQAMIYEALKHYDMLKKGKHGIGFGVGREQLVSVFANENADIVATDQAPDDKALAWDNGQLADGKKSLFFKDLVSKPRFDKNVTFEHHDMNKFEKSYVNKFDFSWSNCVIGHLGSMKQSEAFLKRHAKYLKYGGVSVITTELNISSLTETVAANSGTIIWRLSDLKRVFNDMLDQDMVAERFRLRLVGDDTDYYIYHDIDDIVPSSLLKGDYNRGAFITKIPFSNYAIVQIQIIFKKQRLNQVKKTFYKQIYKKDFARNTRLLRKFINSHGDITDYSTKYETADLPIMPTVKTKTVSAKTGKKTLVKITFENNSQHKFFSYGLHTPLHVPPLVLATANPANRKSALRTPGWFSDNRPAVEFKPVYDKTKFSSVCHGSHRSLPGEKLTFAFEIEAPNKKGKHIEDFALVLEGVGDIPKSQFSLSVNVI